MEAWLLKSADERGRNFIHKSTTEVKNSVRREAHAVLYFEEEGKMKPFHRKTLSSFVKSGSIKSVNEPVPQHLAQRNQIFQKKLAKREKTSIINKRNDYR